MTCGSVFISGQVKRTGIHFLTRGLHFNSPLPQMIPNLHTYVRINYIDTISDMYRIIKIRGLSNVTYNKKRHSAECTIADDLFGAYFLSCHLVSRMKTTICTCAVDHRVVAQRVYLHNSGSSIKLTGSP